MNKIADYLQKHLLGEVTAAAPIRNYFSTDASIYKFVPQVVVNPKSEQDIRKLTRFSWQLAERGKALPIVARGNGTDFSGSAIGQSVVLNMTSHLSQLISFDDRKGIVVVEPGMKFGKLQHMLSFSHSRYIPAYPDSLEYSSIGGAVANNSGGERSLRYGRIVNYVKGLKVVLANGEVIETERISKRDLKKKISLSGLEGEIYKAVDALLTEYANEITALKDINAEAAYNINRVRDKNGSIDLTPLFVGSKGTLGVISQIKLATDDYSPNIDQLYVVLKDRSKLNQIINCLLEFKPITCDYYDATILNAAKLVYPDFLSDILVDNLVPAGIIACDFQDLKKRSKNGLIKQLTKKLQEYQASCAFFTEEQADTGRQLNRLVHTLFTRRFGTYQLVPGIDEVMVPIEKLDKFLVESQSLFSQNGIEVVISCRAGEGIVHAFPIIDIGQLVERQRLVKLADEYHRLALSFSGSIAAEYGDGRSRGHLTQTQLGDKMYEAIIKLKAIFDPYEILNPGVKTNVNPKHNINLIRKEYDLRDLYIN